MSEIFLGDECLLASTADIAALMPLRAMSGDSFLTGERSHAWPRASFPHSLAEMNQPITIRSTISGEQVCLSSHAPMPPTDDRMWQAGDRNREVKERKTAQPVYPEHPRRERLRAEVQELLRSKRIIHVTPSVAPPGSKR